jgi:CBS domain-containing protein
MTLEYFPKGTVILRAGRRASDSLYVVQKGGVQLALRTEVGKELILDMRSEGEIFGVLSLIGRDVARLDVTAIEDTLCYAIPAAVIEHLTSTYTEVADYLFRTSVTRYMDRSLNELRQQTRLMGDTERLLYSLPIRDAAKDQPVLCAESATISEAARIVSAAKATCLFVVNQEGRAIGIVTDRDFAEHVAARGVSVDLPVTNIMSAPVATVESNQPVFQALLAMLNRGIHHVLVTEEGLPKSVLTNHDLLLLQGKSPLSVVRHLEQQATIDDLAAAQKRITDLLPLLMREGAKASHITRVVAEINDRVMSRILELAEAQLGPAPLRFCWVTLGSEGRCEQTFKTDQDNALIYANVTEDTVGSADQYFTGLANFVRDALERCGYPRCPGNYMASNPFWRQSLNGWQHYFSEWITGAARRSVEDALIFFDMRPVAGDKSLFEALAAHNRELLGPASLFKSVLAFISTEYKPPLGFFRTFVVERTGDHKDELDLKMHGAGPIVNAARLLALEAGIPHTNTVDRLTALETVEGQDQKLLRDLRDAFEFVMLLRLECQLRQARAGQPLGNYVHPETLTALQRSLLKETFQTIARTQSIIESKFRSAVWWQLGR